MTPADSGVSSYCRPLERLSRCDERTFGGKSAALGELLAAGFPVPPGFALATSALDEVVSQAGLDSIVCGALTAARPGEVESVQRAARTIGDAIRSAPLPEEIREELHAGYRTLAAQAADESPPVAVRSSAVGEDSREATFAGQQVTHLWVRGIEQVCDAVGDCWASLYGAPAIAYRTKLGERTAAAMGVTIQLMVDAAISGVMFTCNPVSGDPSMVAINASWGLGLAVVGGEVTPDDYLVSKVTGEVVRERVGAKHVQHVPRSDAGGIRQVEVPPERREAPCLDGPMLAALVALARRVEHTFGGHQDIEWAIARSGETFVLQSRPVTVSEKRDPAPPRSAISLVMGTFGVRARGEH